MQRDFESGLFLTNSAIVQGQTRMHLSLSLIFINSPKSVNARGMNFEVCCVYAGGSPSTARIETPLLSRLSLYMSGYISACLVMQRERENAEPKHVYSITYVSLSHCRSHQHAADICCTSYGTCKSCRRICIYCSCTAPAFAALKSSLPV